MQGYYASDPEGVVEAMGAMYRGDFRDYLKKHVHSVASHEEYLDKVVGGMKKNTGVGGPRAGIIGDPCAGAE